MVVQIGKMLRGRKPKVINGPEILSKFVGEAEARIRELFADAEAEYKARGENSSLHIIIFDEIDAVCKVCERKSSNTFPVFLLPAFVCVCVCVCVDRDESRPLTGDPGPPATRVCARHGRRGRHHCQSAAVED